MELKYYFGLDCIKRFATDLLTIETENNFKYIKQVIFNAKDELYHNANTICQICSKLFKNK